MKKNLTALSMIAMGLSLVGCSTITTPPPISKFDKTGVGELYVGMGVETPNSAGEACKKASVKDERCYHPTDFYMRNGLPSFKGTTNSYIPVLIPNGVLVESGDIIQIRMKEGAPANFVKLITKSSQKFDKSADCYLDRTIIPFLGEYGGVVCPKYNWDYRDYVPSS